MLCCGLCCGVCVWLVATRLAGFGLFVAGCFHLGAFCGLCLAGVDSYPQPAQNASTGADVAVFWLLCWRGCWLAGCGFVLCSLPIATGNSRQRWGGCPLLKSLHEGGRGYWVGVLCGANPLFPKKEKNEKFKKRKNRF